MPFENKIPFQPLELTGHSRILTALALGNCSTPKQLVSAADDYVIVWNLNQARQNMDKGTSVEIVKLVY